MMNAICVAESMIAPDEKYRDSCAVLRLVTVEVRV
jgi:hypothetical protein